jgi:hypothetical protein
MPLFYDGKQQPGDLENNRYVFLSVDHTFLRPGLYFFGWYAAISIPKKRAWLTSISSKRFIAHPS